MGQSVLPSHRPVVYTSLLSCSGFGTTSTQQQSPVFELCTLASSISSGHPFVLCATLHILTCAVHSILLPLVTSGRQCPRIQASFLPSPNTVAIPGPLSPCPVLFIQAATPSYPRQHARHHDVCSCAVCTASGSTTSHVIPHTHPRVHPQVHLEGFGAANVEHH